MNPSAKSVHLLAFLAVVPREEQDLIKKGIIRALFVTQITKEFKSLLLVLSNLTPRKTPTLSIMTTVWAMTLRILTMKKTILKLKRDKKLKI